MMARPTTARQALTAKTLRNDPPARARSTAARIGPPRAPAVSRLRCPAKERPSSARRDAPEIIASRGAVLRPFPNLSRYIIPTIGTQAVPAARIPKRHAAEVAYPLTASSLYRRH